MKKGPAIQMKVLEMKKLKTEKVYIGHLCNIKNEKFRNETISYLTTPIDLIKILQDIDIDDDVLKSQIINTALDQFLKNKQPTNLSFRKYLKNFQKFNVFSLICAYSYMQIAEISSKGDIRTFIYIYLGFNILSTKYIDDYSVWNSNLIKLWGVSLFQARQLEIFALKSLKYNLNIDIESISNLFLNITDHK